MMPFITFREDNENGVAEYFIVQKSFPNYCGKILPHPTENEFANAPVAGYNLWIVWWGRIDGNFIPSYKDVLIEIDIVFKNMALWYLAERVEKKPKKYAKFKIK